MVLKTKDGFGELFTCDHPNHPNDRGWPRGTLWAKQTADGPGFAPVSPRERIKGSHGATYAQMFDFVAPGTGWSLMINYLGLATLSDLSFTEKGGRK